MVAAAGGGEARSAAPDPRRSLRAIPAIGLRPDTVSRVNESFSPDAAAAVGPRPGRADEARSAAALDLPTSESEEWRYSPIRDLPTADLRPATAAPDRISDPEGADAPDRFESVVTERAATAVVVDGFVVSVTVGEGWAAKGLVVAADEIPETLDRPEPLTVFDRLHRAFAPSALRIEVPEGMAVTAPIVVLTHHHTAGVAAFPHLIVRTGTASEVSVVERQTSGGGLGLSVPVVELAAGDASQLRYLVIQENGTEHWQLGRQLSVVGAQATLNSGIAAFGGRYARTRTDSWLRGRGGTANLVAAYYGDGDQVLDFRTFQHHEARDTRSDLLFKGSQDDRSGSIYTGLIQIHPEGAGSNAFQTNRNVKLSDDAWAWSVPNLEIENNDVHCSHASTVSPVDADQRFYLHARGVPPTVADRLIVAGFYHDVIERLPVPAARAEVRRLIAEKLDRRTGDT
jgi:Fe-S cluster assembly protein SufD